MSNKIGLLISGAVALITTTSAVGYANGKKKSSVSTDSLTSPFDKASIDFLGWLNRYMAEQKAMGGDYGFGDAGYVRFSPMYTAFGSIRYLSSGSTEDGKGLRCGTAAALNDYIRYNARAGGRTYGLGQYQMEEIIYAYLDTVTPELGRAGIIVSYPRSLIAAADLGKIVSKLGAIIGIIGGVILAPVTGGATLLAAAPLIYNVVKKK